MAEPGSFSVRFPSAGASAGSDFLNAYQASRTLALREAWEQRQAIIQALQRREAENRMAEQAALGRMRTAAAGAPDEPIEVVPARTLAGPMLSPATSATPEALVQDEMGQAAPVTMPATLATPEVRGPGTVIPAETIQAPTMGGLRRSLAGDPKALAQLATSEGERARKARGILTDEEVRTRQRLAALDQESGEMLKDAGEATDFQTFAIKMAGYARRRSAALAASDPARSAEAEKLSMDLMRRAVEVRADRKAHDEDAVRFKEATALLRGAGALDPDKVDRAMEILSKTRSPGGQAIVGTIFTHVIDNALKRVANAPVQAALDAVWTEAVTTQKGPPYDMTKARQAVMARDATHRWALTTAPGALGERIREQDLGLRLPRGQFESVVQAERERAAARGETVPDHEIVDRAVIRLHAQPGVDRREADRRAGERYRDERRRLEQIVQEKAEDVRRVRQDIAAAARSARVNEVPKDALPNALKAERVAREALRALQRPPGVEPATAPAAPSPPVAAPPATAPPAAPAAAPAARPGSAVAPNPAALPQPAPAATSGFADMATTARARQRAQELKAQGRGPADILNILIQEGLAQERPPLGR